jgi:hypothetical protein
MLNARILEECRESILRLSGPPRERDTDEAKLWRAFAAIETANDGDGLSFSWLEKIFYRRTTARPSDRTLTKLNRAVNALPPTEGDRNEVLARAHAATFAITQKNGDRITALERAMADQFRQLEESRAQIRRLQQMVGINDIPPDPVEDMKNDILAAFRALPEEKRWNGIATVES